VIQFERRNDITCNEEELSVVMDVFNRTQSTELAEITIYKSHIDESIPDNIFSSKKTGKITFDCLNYPFIKIDKDAFDSSRQYLTVMELYRYIWAESDLNFIEGFIKMTSLYIDSFHGMERAFPTFPANLPAINNIKLIHCVGWNSLVNAPPPVVGATNFARLDVTKSVDMNDDVMNLVLEWANQSFNSTLKSLYINFNNLTRIPFQIQFFGKLDTLDMRNNLFSIIPAGSLKFTTNDLTLIDLSNCGVQVIEPNAFEGKKNLWVFKCKSKYKSRNDYFLFQQEYLKQRILI